jgi:type I restriction enzyme M protein
LLDTDTKRRIDTARDILVGKVPDPKSQVEQITIALIYKFMDDMDAEAEELGGKRKFFTGDYARFGWAKLMRAGLGGHETLSLYAESIATMPKNPGIPPLFREIFKNAYLPYRDPETLKSFLKIIDEFSYDHSERLGDAFEYLLSVLGSQGDAGQFRTPRHIIDFIVSIVDPKKTDTILDPACGTAGFLISAYKHVLAANTDAKGKVNLTPDERGILAQHIKGYDISPDMVRLSLVNLYLHGFADPHIYEYDTLTQEERWNELADVILANPPFMSPKGGIKPHKKFSIDAKRSEVLFVDYMAEHLTTNGRAGIIVPEGVIFQNQTAYKDLRKMLVKSSLVAVVSLPAGCFNPYSGVKTSILILDKSLAKQSDAVGFFKVGNDGFGLGAQRRAMDGSDLPQVKADIDAFFHTLRAQQPTAGVQLSSGLIATKVSISENGDYNLSGERYRESEVHSNLKWPLVPIGEICVVERGASPRPIHDFITNQPDGVNWIKIGDAEVGAKYIVSTKERITPEGAARSRRVKAGDFVLSNSMSFGRPYIMATDGCIHDGWLLLRNQADGLDQDFLYNILSSKLVFAQFESAATGGVVNNLNSEIVRSVRIPLPPLNVQKEIVAEIEGYQKVIDGARVVIDNYRPRISVHPDWPLVPLAEACEIQRGKFSFRPRNEPRFYGGVYPFIQTGDIVRANGRKIKYTQTLNEEGLSVSKLFQPTIVVITIAANIGDTAVLDFPACFPDSVVGLIPNPETDAHFLELAMRAKKQYLNDIAPQAAQKNINIEILKTIEVPLPPLATQQAIVAEIETEETLVSANRELIARFEKKIQATLARVWGEDELAAPEA